MYLFTGLTLADISIAEKSHIKAGLYSIYQPFNFDAFSDIIVDGGFNFDAFSDVIVDGPLFALKFTFWF